MLQTVEEGFDISHRYDKGPLPLVGPSNELRADKEDIERWPAQLEFQLLSSNGSGKLAEQVELLQGRRQGQG